MTENQKIEILYRLGRASDAIGRALAGLAGGAGDEVDTFQAFEDLHEHATELQLCYNRAVSEE